jgi:ferritin-like metal-binding protein YciE
MKLENLHDLFMLELQSIYDAEQQITQAIPQLLTIVQSPQLKEALESHLKETESQIERLEKICHEIDCEPVGKQSIGMEGIIEEAIELLQDNLTPSAILDAALISCLQKIEHYEISSYGSASAHAKQLENDSALNILIDIMGEEKKCDEELSSLAEEVINKLADSSTSTNYAM